MELGFVGLGRMEEAEAMGIPMAVVAGSGFTAMVKLVEGRAGVEVDGRKQGLTGA